MATSSIAAVSTTRPTPRTPIAVDARSDGEAAFSHVLESVRGKSQREDKPAAEAKPKADAPAKAARGRSRKAQTKPRDPQREAQPQEPTAADQEPSVLEPQAASLPAEQVAVEAETTDAAAVETPTEQGGDEVAVVENPLLMNAAAPAAPAVAEVPAEQTEATPAIALPAAASAAPVAAAESLVPAAEGDAPEQQPLAPVAVNSQNGAAEPADDASAEGSQPTNLTEEPSDGALFAARPRPAKQSGDAENAAVVQQRADVDGNLPPVDADSPASSAEPGPGRAAPVVQPALTPPAVVQHAPAAPAMAKPLADAATAALTSPPEVDFAQRNHSGIVSNIHGRLLPNGGSMQIRLDPPELGALQVNIQMRDGQMVAMFQTSNDQATRLLSHSLDALRQSLESGGVTVERLQVQQAPREFSQQQNDPQQQRQGAQDQSQFDEQRRREVLRRMWRRVAGNRDPLDLTA